MVRRRVAGFACCRLKPRCARLAGRRPLALSGSKTKNPINFVDRVHVLEAASGFEPENNGFAGRRLTTWPSRRNRWSGKRDLNSRRQPWQGCTLPLSYSRSAREILYPHGLFEVNRKKRKEALFWKAPSPPLYYKMEQKSCGV